MKSIKISELIDNINYIEVIGNKDIFINAFNKDTRTINNGNLYFGIKGENFDGNRFYIDAFLKGASACIIDNKEVIDLSLDYRENCLILVEDSVKALNECAAYLRSKIKVPVIAITGSAGKTSTKDMLAYALSPRYRVFKSRENYNNEIGCPLMVSEYNDEDIMILEMGTSNMGELDLLTKMAKPDVALITNIGSAHIGQFGSIENTLKAKTEIVNGLSKDGVLFLNVDDQLLHKYYLENKDKLKMITYGIDNEADVRPTEVYYRSEDSSIYFDDIRMNVSIGGKHYVYNTLASIAVAKHFGLTYKEIYVGLENLKLSSNRMSITKVGDTKIINDAYNASPEAMEYALEYLSNQIGTNLAVLGSMKELGNYTEDLHKKIARKILSLDGIDTVYLIGEEMKIAYDYLISKNYDNVKYFTDYDELLECIKNTRERYDNILLKGSHSVGLYKIVDEL